MSQSGKDFIEEVGEENLARLEAIEDFDPECLDNHRAREKLIKKLGLKVWDVIEGEDLFDAVDTLVRVLGALLIEVRPTDRQDLREEVELELMQELDAIMGIGQHP
jgi:hypothetical protein